MISFLLNDHRITALGNFTSNAFSNDQIGFGAEYGYKKYLMLRAGYNAQSDITNKDLSPTVYTGLSMGATFEVPLNDKGATFRQLIMLTLQHMCLMERMLLVLV